MVWVLVLMMNAYWGKHGAALGSQPRPHEQTYMNPTYQRVLCAGHGDVSKGRMPEERPEWSVLVIP